MWRAGECLVSSRKQPDYQTPSKLKSRQAAFPLSWANQLSTAGASVLIG